MRPNLPKCVKLSSKPSNFCPGCGHSLTLKNLGFVLDNLNFKNTVFVTDIGCSLLSWDYFNLDTVQTHHGRAGVTALGIKLGRPEATVIAYMGDGGGYSIGLHHLIHLAKRNEPITLILVNNTVFAMTGGQAAPTTLEHENTESTPGGVFADNEPIFGPELLAQVAHQDAFLARTSVGDIPQLKAYLEKAIRRTKEKNAFSFVEVLAYCPVNWKKDARGCLEYLGEIKKTFKPGVIKDES